MYLGFDIGGSSIKAALVQKNKIVGTRYERLPKSYSAMIKTAVAIKNDFSLNKAIRIEGIGFSIAGAMDRKREKMLNSPNITFLNGKNIAKDLQKGFPRIPIKIERDSYCFLIAEAAQGNGKKYRHIFYVTLGTGIGGALMLDRKIITGFHGSAAEVGHTIADAEKGTHWEDIAANKFIRREMKLSFSEAKQRALSGDKKSSELFRTLGRNIGLVIANIINSFDPEVVIISGGLAAGRQLFAGEIKKAVNQHVISKDAQKTKILWSKLGRFGGALGAALLFEKR